MASLVRTALVLLFLTAPLANARDYVCIGKGDDPRQDFYAKKLDGLINYTLEASIKRNELEAKNDAIDTKIAAEDKIKQDLKNSARDAKRPEMKQEIEKLIDVQNEKIKALNKLKQANYDSTPIPDAEKRKAQDRPEDYLQYQGINDINKNLSKFKFISDWWLSQGVKRSSETRGGICESCGEIPNKILASLYSIFKVPTLKENCVTMSIGLKKADNHEIMCEHSQKQVGSTHNMCVTEDMANYTQWSLNKAFACLGTVTDPIDPQVIFKKLNNESTFRFFYAYNGGQGLMQTITCAQDEVLGMSPSVYCGGGKSKVVYRSQARKELAAVMNNNPEDCDIYSNIIDFKKEATLDTLRGKLNSTRFSMDQMKKTDFPYLQLKNSLDTDQKKYNDLLKKYPQYNQRLFDAKQASACDFVAMQNGIHRNILSGLGLYLHYRMLADQDLESLWGPNIKKHPQYKKIRDLTALAYYGPAGPGGAKIKLARMIPTLKAHYRNINKMTPQDYENKLKDNFKYIKAANKSEDQVAGSKDLECIE